MGNRSNGGGWAAKREHKTTAGMREAKLRTRGKARTEEGQNKTQRLSAGQARQKQNAAAAKENENTRRRQNKFDRSREEVMDWANRECEKAKNKLSAAPSLQRVSSGQ